MRVELDRAALRHPLWPEGVRVRSFTPNDAESLHALLVHGYRHGGGSIAAFDVWLAQMTTDQEFDSALWFLAGAQGTLVGAALCWTSASVKDLVVHESWRSRGLGEALLRHVFETFAMRGAEAVDLKVEAANTSAVDLYRRLDMRIDEQHET